MYREHVPVIAASMRETPEGFKRGVLFALLSIRQPITYVRSMLADVDENRAEAVCLLGFKRQAYRQLELEGVEMWRELRNVYDARAVILRLQRLHGLGIVKAAFVAQLMGCDVACIDSRNADREGRPRRAWDYHKTRITPAGLGRKVDRYLADVGGKACEYWDTWCNDAGETYKLTGEQISELHLDILADDYIPF